MLCWDCAVFARETERDVTNVSRRKETLRGARLFRLSVLSPLQREFRAAAHT